MINDNIILYLSTLKNGNVDNFENIISKMKEERIKENAVIDAFRFAVTNILKMTPIDAAKTINMNTLEKLKLSKYIDKDDYNKNDLTKKDKINFPKGLPMELKPIYMLSKAFPDFTMSNQWIIDEYKTCILKNKPLPASFFSDSMGTQKAYACLLTAIKEFGTDTSLKELYEKFSDSKWVSEFFKKAHLATACKNLFGDEPLLYLNYTLGDQNSKIYYEAFSFLKAFNVKKKDMDNRKKKQKG